MLVLPFDSAHYAEFQQEFLGLCGVELPVYKVNKPLKLGSIRALVYFEPDGTAKFVGVERNLVPFLRRAVRQRLVPYFSVALRPLLVRLGVTWRQPPVSTFILFYLSLFALFFAGILASLVGGG